MASASAGTVKSPNGPYRSSDAGSAGTRKAAPDAAVTATKPSTAASPIRDPLLTGPPLPA